jgi:hypothetical protein
MALILLDLILDLSLANLGIIFGVAINKSKFKLPWVIWSIKSSFPMISAPADFASSKFSSFVKTAIRVCFPTPFGKVTVVRNC